MPRRKNKVGVSDLEEAQSKFNKEFIQLGSDAYGEEPEIWPTGIEEFDGLLTDPSGEPLGGLPSRGLYIIAGQPGSGKTLVVTHMARALQQAGKRVAWVDSERRLQVGGLKRLRNLGVDPNALIMVGGGSIVGSPVGYILEDVLGVISSMAAGKMIDAIIIDSTTSLIPRQLADHALGGEVPFDAKAQAITARALSITLPIMSGICSDFGITAYLICQLRENPGVMFGRSEYIPGGKAAQFHAHGIFTLSSPASSSYDEEAQTHKCKLTVWKSAVTTDHMKQVECFLKTSLETPNEAN